MNLINEFENEVSKKPTWNSQELIAKIKILHNKLVSELQKNGTIDITKSSKKTVVNVIKKYDVVYLQTLGIPHYILVYRVSEDSVIGITLSSKDKVHSIHQIKKDRYFENSYATNSFVTLPVEDCFKNFIRVFENKTESDLIFYKVKNYTFDLLSNKSKIYKKQITKKPIIQTENI